MQRVYLGSNVFIAFLTYRGLKPAGSFPVNALAGNNRAKARGVKPAKGFVKQEIGKPFRLMYQDVEEFFCSLP